MVKRKTAKQIYKNGKPEDFDTDHIIEIVHNLYAKKLAEAWFIGMEWVEGFHYCRKIDFLRKTFAPSVLKHHRRAIWFACTFLD